MAQPLLQDMNLERELRRQRARASPYIVHDDTPSADDWGYDEERILWLELPSAIADRARLGVVPTRMGAIFVLRVRDGEDYTIERGIEGYPSDMLDLAGALFNGVGLIRGLSGDAAHDASIIAEARMAQGR